MRWRRRQRYLFLCLHGHRYKRRRIALPKALVPLIELPRSHIMRAAIGRYALTAGLLRRYQLTPALNCFFSDKTHDSRMPPMSYSLKMRFTQRSHHNTLTTKWGTKRYLQMDRLAEIVAIA